MIMLDDRALGEAVDASFMNAFRRLADRDSGLVARFGSVEVAAMGLPVGLQSSPDGVPVYERMGFRTVVEYLEFEPA